MSAAAPSSSGGAEPAPDQPPAQAPEQTAIAACLDLVGTPCPLNFIRTRLALERIPDGAWLQVDLDPGEPLTMVSQGMATDGHGLRQAPRDDGSVRLWICRHGA
ncbi:sulfurtransferase TusA family protein [Synechococcus sp. CS-1328]|uniref:sulfurtransferase TusA family protein n=1 Tax=Synechococcus sp. CS-1328 TaxID=2847976 RepID=UPI0028808940|nr:sulfurtransferase TusA family protein [Synechococcus sp. CS-1328]MCT0224266.1 sulfurtransferase TusA family protein [Synechococcus sp. CS-1328]